MQYYALDCETRDPLLADQGPSHFWGEGEIIVTGIYDCQKKRKGYLDGNGGEKIKSLLTSPDVTLIGTNIQYDLLWLCYEHKLKVKECICCLIDISVAESMIDEYAPFSLDDLARKYLKERKGIDVLKNICASLNLKGDARKHLGTLWDKGYKDEIRDYVISDVEQPAEIWKIQEKLLKKEGAFPAFLVNMRCVKILAASRQRGIRVDYERWKENCDAVKPIHDRAEKEFFKKYGEVNINSPKQMGDFMAKNNVPFRNRITVRGWEPEGRKFSKKLDQFTGKEIWDQRKRLKEDFPGIRVEKDKLRLYVDNRYAHRTEEQLIRAGYNITSAPNIDKFFVKENKAEFPVVADLETYKQVKSIISKFLGPKFGRFIVDNGNGEYRVHPEVNVVGARMTSRMSSSKFNAQNIPSKTKLFEGTEHEVDLSVMCREIFIPEKGHIWVKLDYSGQEAILQAHFAVGEAGEVIRARYHENSRLDTHQFVADVSGLSNEFSRKTARKYAKNLNFGLAYGMQQARMSAQFGWDKELTERLYEQITSASPWIKETMEAVEEAVVERGYVMTLLGRRSHLKKGDENKLYVFYNKLIQGCQRPDMRIHTTEGLLRFDELPEHPSAKVLIDNKEYAFEHIVSGKKHCWDLVDSDGNSITISDKTPVCVFRNGAIRQVQVKDVVVGDLVPTSNTVSGGVPVGVYRGEKSYGGKKRNNAIWNKKVFDIDGDNPEWWYLFGYLLGDGHCTPKEFRFVGNPHKDYAQMDRILSLMHSVSVRCTHWIKPTGNYECYSFRSATLTKFYSTVLGVDVTTLHGAGKRIPTKVFSLPVGCRAAIAQAMMDGDGTVSNDINWVSSHPLLADDFMLLLASLGIPTRKYVWPYENAVRVHIGNRQAYCEAIGFTCVHKKEKMWGKRHKGYSYPPEVFAEIRKDIDKLALPDRMYIDNNSLYVSVNRMRSGGAALTDYSVQKLFLLCGEELPLLAKYRWVTIAEKKDAGVIETQDIHVHSEEHLYTSWTGMITHNSGSDQLKLSLAALDEEDLCDYFLLPVHDELNFSLPMSKAGLTALGKMQRIMETAAVLDVPVHCDPEAGNNWAYLEGQYKYTEEDAKEGKCTEKEITYPKETLQQLWTRMCADVKKGKKARVRVFDDAEVSLEDDEEEEDEA